MYYINSVFNIPVLQLMQLTYPGPWKHQQIDLESPSHLFFPGHTCFFLAVNELNLTFLMVLLGSVFLLGWGMEHHTRRWSSIGWIRWLVAAGDLNLRSWINGPRTGGVYVGFLNLLCIQYVMCVVLFVENIYINMYQPSMHVCTW